MRLLLTLNKSFARIFSFPVIIKGVKVYFNSADRFLAAMLWKTGRLEGFEMELFSRFVKPRITMLDIGANMGVYSLTSSNVIGDKGKIIAFEPDKDHVKTFTKSIKANGFENIKLYPFAVSDKNETLVFHADTFNSGNNQVAKENENNKNELHVQAVCLDDFLKDMPTVDLIKMDIQGAEYFAFIGMKTLLERNPDVVVFAEYWKKGLEKMNVNPADYINLLASFHFNFYKIDNDSRQVKQIHTSDILNNPEFDKTFLNLIFCRNAIF